MTKKQNNAYLCFVIPYFGKLPKNVQLFLDSAACNPDFNWLIITDDYDNYSYPENVHVNYMSFDQLRQRIQKVFDFQISLKTPKKLCDYKPAYGYIFRKELSDYEYWGYCDLDMILGKLNMFLTKSYLSNFDKVFTLGHMSIFRNSDEINSLFMKEYKNRNAIHCSYKDVLQDERNFAFDEWPENTVNINVLAEQEGLRVSGDWFMSDILPHRSSFKESFYDFENHKWSDGCGPNVIIIKKGDYLYKAWINYEGNVEMQDILYAHIQKRDLSTKYYNLHDSDFFIIPNRIISVLEINEQTIKKYISCGKLRRLMKIDELLWKITLGKGLWKHRVQKYIIRK